MHTDKHRSESHPQRIALVNGRIVLPTAIVEDKALLIENGHIAGLVAVSTVGQDVTSIDVDGRLIAPGLIDIHTHGALGHSFNEPTAAAFTAITAENARRGVTSLLATTATDSIENLVAVLEFFEQWHATVHTLAPRC